MTNGRISLVSLLAVNLVLNGCQCTTSQTRRPVDGSTDTDFADGVVSQSDAPSFDGSGRIGALRITPNTATLEVELGQSTPATVQFHAEWVYGDGSTAPAPEATFSLSSRSLGEMDPTTGLFESNRSVGGTVAVVASVVGISIVEATLAVNLRTRSTVQPPDNVRAQFESGAPSIDNGAGLEVVYPLPGAVLPQNVAPVDVQWLVTPAGSWARVRLIKPHASAAIYVNDTGQHHYLVDRDVWRALIRSDVDAPLEIFVDSLSADAPVTRDAIPLRFAQAALSGSTYYWAIREGKIFRIQDGAGAREDFMGLPEQSAAGFDQGTCVGCHSVSASGRYMVGRVGGARNKALVFDLTRDLRIPNGGGFSAPAEYASANAPIATFTSWSPDDARFVAVSDIGGQGASASYVLEFYRRDGTRNNVTGTVPPQATHPVWSPDGTRIAYASGIPSGQWGGAHTSAGISVVDIAGDVLSNPRQLHDGPAMQDDMPNGDADAYPTWSPDSNWIAFHHGTSSRSESAQSALYWMRADGTGVVRLSNGCGGAATINNYQPRFSPFNQGGYFWLSFLSTRPYGNAQVGSRGRTAPVSGSDSARTSLQQIWVMAIDANPQAGADPSHVPYWLAGQDPTQQNIAAFWASRACRVDGTECSVDGECCGGVCIPDAHGVRRCAPPPPERCRRESESCTSDTDCCPGSGLQCLNNVCQGILQ